MRCDIARIVTPVRLTQNERAFLFLAGQGDISLAIRKAIQLLAEKNKFKLIVKL